MQFCLILCGVTGSWYVQGLFGHSEHLWWVWGLISICNFAPPTVLLGLLLCPWTCYLLKVASVPHSHCFSTYHLAGASLPLDVGYLPTVTPALHSSHMIE